MELQVPRAQTAETAEWEPMRLRRISCTVRREVQEQEELVERVHAEQQEEQGLTRHAHPTIVKGLVVKTAREPEREQEVAVVMTGTQQTAPRVPQVGTLLKESLELMVQMALMAPAEIPVQMLQEQLLATTGLAMLQQPAQPEQMVLEEAVAVLEEA
jgi:hypothetical protein